MFDYLIADYDTYMCVVPMYHATLARYRGRKLNYDLSGTKTLNMSDPQGKNKCYTDVKCVPFN